MSTTNLRDFIAGMPKGENHLHIEGTIYPEWALVFAKKNHIELPFSTPEEFYKLIDFNSLSEFLVLFNKVGSCVVTQDDYHDLVIKVAQEGKEQNIIYREIMFTNASHLGRGITLETFMNGFRKGREYVQANLGVDLKFIAELDRMQSAEYSLEYVKSLKDYTDLISAVGLDFSENGYPARVHAEAFHLAREMGYVVTNHAGEECGPESVRDSLDSCGASRIDHGVRAIEDPRLVKRLADEKIFLTISPIGNVGIACADLESHPIKKLYDAGVPLSINSDDPPFINHNLVDNYLEVIQTFRLGKDEIYQIARNAFQYSLADEGAKARYISQLDQYFASHELKLDW